MASIEWSRTVRGVTYLKIRCIGRHWFLMPADDVTLNAPVDQPPSPAAGRQTDDIPIDDISREI